MASDAVLTPQTLREWLLKLSTDAHALTSRIERLKYLVKDTGFTAREGYFRQGSIGKITDKQASAYYIDHWTKDLINNPASTLRMMLNDQPIPSDQDAQKRVFSAVLRQYNPLPGLVHVHAGTELSLFDAWKRELDAEKSPLTPYMRQLFSSLLQEIQTQLDEVCSVLKQVIALLSEDS